MKTLLTLVLIFFASALNAQNVAFAADKMNVLYIGVDNPITIVAENLNCKDLKAITNNGKIIGKGCKLIIIPEKIGTAKITVQTKKNKWTEAIFRVKEIPPPIFKIGTGQLRIPLVALKNQQFVRADIENFDIDVRFLIDSFTVSIFSKETSTYKEVKNISNKITEETKQLFDSLKPGDEILFKDIFSHKFNGEVFMLEPVLIAVY
ncbi:MAG: hypothetical protein KA319_04630 [Ferruginibacter sp.]|nr:hypothetical protein [Ferruginibacter sp.]